MSTSTVDDEQEQNIRVEQVRLVFLGMKNSLYLGVTLAFLLLLALYDSERRTELLGWFSMVLAGRLLCVGYARWALRRGVGQHNASRLIVHMCAIKAFEGLAWGLLAWIAIGQASLPEQLLVMASLAGVGSNAVSLLAPVFPLYLSMQIVQVLTISGKLWIIGDHSYRMLAIGCALYVAGQTGQALLAQRASRRSIALRFENLELVERLRGLSVQAEQARIKAEEANLAKSKFLAAASHDLRQPVHAQELFLEVLARSKLSGDQHKVLNNARVASQASAEMLNTLLDFSRIEAGVITPRRCVFRLQPLLNKLANELGGLADAKGIIYRSRETHLAVDSDPALLERILRNLVANAIRYTEKGGLLVACRKRGDRVSIEVVDTGIGIEARQQREIFREFHQLGNPERDRLKGLGLGLAISDGLVRSLGHDLSLVSTPGRGSIFRVLLPLARADFSEDLHDLMGGPELPRGLLQGLRVLVIEDDVSLRVGMLQLLAEWGCECRTVEGLDDALTVVRAWSVQLLISDYRLREHQTGAQVIARAREAAGRELPALIITGDTAPERLREAHDSGVPLLHKPVSPAQLYRTMVDLSGVREERYAY